MEGATYRGKHSSEFGLAVRTNPGLMPDFGNNLIDDIPGMSGAYYVNSEYGTRPITLEVGFLADDYQDYTQRLRKLADWLRPDEGPGAYVADHEPNKTYYAVLESAEMERVENIARMGEGSIELVCPDPFAYGEEQSQFIAETVSVANEGTAESYPVFELEITDKSELITIANKNHTDSSDNPLEINVGTETDVDDGKEEQSRLILHDTMQDTSSWTDGSDVDNGEPSGTMKADEDGFYADDYGEGEKELSEKLQKIEDDYQEEKDSLTSDIDELKRERERIRDKDDPDKDDKKRIKEIKDEIKNIRDDIAVIREERNEKRSDLLSGKAEWTGPAMKHELEETVKSFHADIHIANSNATDVADGKPKYKGSTGIIEVYFFDVNDEKVAKVQFGDTSGERRHNRFQFVVGNKRYELQGRHYGTFNDYDGVLRVSRDSGYFYPKMSGIDADGNKTDWYTANGGNPIRPQEVDPGGSGSHEVKSIQVAARKYKGSPRIWQRIKEVKVYSTIGAYEWPEDTVVVEDFEIGDTVTIDTGKGLVMKNGEERTDLIQMDSDMFTLVEGMNKLEFSDNVKGKVIYQERYL